MDKTEGDLSKFQIIVGMVAQKGKALYNQLMKDIHQPQTLLIE
jgi:hypothetical protein